MITNIKARFSDGVLTPLVPIDLKDGEVVTLHIENLSTPHHILPDSGEKSQPSPVAPSFTELLEEIHESATQANWESLPTDGAKNLKHYLYCREKECDR